MVLDTSLLNTQQYWYISRVKWSNPKKGVASSFTPWCWSYWKGNLLVTFDNGCQLFFFLLFYHTSSLLQTTTTMTETKCEEIRYPRNFQKLLLYNQQYYWFVFIYSLLIYLTLLYQITIRNHPKKVMLNIFFLFLYILFVIFSVQFKKIWPSCE